MEFTNLLERSEQTWLGQPAHCPTQSRMKTIKTHHSDIKEDMNALHSVLVPTYIKKEDKA